MSAVKAFLESVDGACPDVAKNYTQGADNQYKGCIFVGRVIGFRVGGGKIEFIEKWDSQSQPYYKSFRKRKFTKGSLSAQIFLFPVPEIAGGFLKDCPKERQYLLKLVFCFAGFEELRR
jgi:hypothetical protein